MPDPAREPGASATPVRLPVWARPGSDRDSLGWDPWRSRWVVHCRAPALAGAANEAIRTLVAGWLGLAPVSVRWARSGRSPAKWLEVDGLSEPEVDARLRRASGRPPA